jgi:1-acyl-sn-glycerol-3-phosphate acyltransferase
MWYWIFRAGFIVFFKLFFNFTVEGLENIPQKTNFIIAANHASWMDPVVIGVAIPKKINFVAMRYLYSIGWLRWFVRLMQALPTGSASRKGAQLLKTNKNVGLFPEGGCSRDGRLKQFRRGVAFLAMKTGRPVVPCAIIGTNEILPRKARFPKLFKSIKVKIGFPIYILKELDEVINDIYLQEGVHKIRNVVKEMLYA